jgi:hypothetical protein
MITIDRTTRRLFLFLAAIGVVILLVNLSLLSGTDVQSKILNIPISIPGTDKKPSPGQTAPPDTNVSSHLAPLFFRKLTNLQPASQT